MSLCKEDPEGVESNRHQTESNRNGEYVSEIGLYASIHIISPPLHTHSHPLSTFSPFHPSIHTHPSLHIYTYISIYRETSIYTGIAPPCLLEQCVQRGGIIRGAHVHQFPSEVQIRLRAHISVHHSVCVILASVECASTIVSLLADSHSKSSIFVSFHSTLKTLNNKNDADLYLHR